MAARPQLAALADSVGVLSSYRNGAGEECPTSDVTRVRLLAALGVDASSEERAAQLLTARCADPFSLPPLALLPERAPRWRCALALPPEFREGTVEWLLRATDEGGEVRVREGRARPRGDPPRIAPRLELPPGCGLWRVDLTVRRGAHERVLHQEVVRYPSRCRTPADLDWPLPSLGVWCNLYSVRSATCAGHGRLADLERLAACTAEQGGSFVAINPLHAIHGRGRDDSPYSPLSRLYRDPLYLDLERIPEWRACAREGSVPPVATRRHDELARASTLDRARLLARDRPILRRLHERFTTGELSRDTPRARAYQAYLTREGDALRDHATFVAIAEHHFADAPLPRIWDEWPAALRDSSSSGVARFRAHHEVDIAFHSWQQFELERQLDTVVSRAAASERRCAILQDLALGCAPVSSEVWAAPALFTTGVEVGAPPDAYAREGQRWGLPPLSPTAFPRGGHRHWLRLLEAQLRHAGALRIDHVAGLLRQYWIPRDAPAREGAYVRTPWRALLACLALASQRHGAVIVGEDLGTVPPELPPLLRHWGVLSTRLLYFHRRRDGRFRPAREFPRRCLVSVQTHDLPPLRGFWSGCDLQLRERAGYGGGEREQTAAREERRRARTNLWRRLRPAGRADTPNEEEPPPEALVGAAHEFVAASPAELVALGLDDLAGEVSPINLPGVPAEDHPSWCRRMTRTLEETMRAPLAPLPRRRAGR